MAKKLRLAVGAWLVAVAVMGLRTAPAAVASGEPSIELSSLTTKPGDQVIVTLVNWPVGPATVSVCGNDARRGSQDCSLLSAAGVGIADVINPTTVGLIVDRPPVPCPCVVRVATSSNAIVRSTRINITGVPTAPTIGPNPIGPVLSVTATITNRSASFFATIRESLGGPARRQLVLVIKNLGTKTADQISTTVAVGRAANSGESLPAPAIGPLAPGEARPYRIPITLSAPSYGRYTVSGTVAGDGVPITFEAATSTTPMLLVLVSVGLIADLGTLVALRFRRRRRVAHRPGILVTPTVAPVPARVAPIPVSRRLEAPTRAPFEMPSLAGLPAEPPRAPAPPPAERVEPARESVPVAREPVRVAAREPVAVGAPAWSTAPPRPAPPAAANRGSVLARWPAGLHRPGEAAHDPVLDRPPRRPVAPAGRNRNPKRLVTLPRPALPRVGHPAPTPSRQFTNNDRERRFFQSRKAAMVTCAAVAGVMVIVYLAATPPPSSGPDTASSGGRSRRSATAASTGTGTGTGTSAPSGVGTPGTSPGAGNGRQGSVVPGAPGGATTTVAPAVVPASIQIDGNTSATDGQVVKVRVTAKTGSQVFGFEIRLCAGDAMFRFDSDFRPTQGGQCLSKPLSAASEFDQEVRAAPPFMVAETTFRVGAGTEHFTTSTGQLVTIACGPGHPCQIALKIQYPDGFAFRAYPVTYR